MANGTTKPMSAVEVGDLVLAQDPDTGERGLREVTRLWIHEDELVDLVTGAGVITTTADHPFWNETDAEWQWANAIDPGEHLLASTGEAISVEGLDHTTARSGLAYNLTVDGIHTYFVVIGDTDALVHNTGCGFDAGAFRGVSSSDAEGLIPTGWNRSPSRSSGGSRYSNPNVRGEQIRIMPGNPRDPNPLKRGPYVRISSDGVVGDPIPLLGNPGL